MSKIKRTWMLNGIAGILFVIISFAASGINKMPPFYNQNTSNIALWFSENWQLFSICHCIAAFAFLPFYFPFFAGFCEILKQAEGFPNNWSRVTWAGAIISPAVGSIGGAFIMGIVLLKGSASIEITQFGLASYFYSITVSGVFAGISMTGAAIVIIKTNVFKRWLGWGGLVTGLLAFISIGSLIENNPQGLLATLNGLVWFGYFIWIGLLSIEMIRKKEGLVN